jgi:hypothetical protein
MKHLKLLRVPPNSFAQSKGFKDIKYLLSFCALFASVLSLSACGSSASMVSEGSLLKAFDAQKDLKISLDNESANFFYKSLGKDFKYYNSDPFGVLAFNSVSEADKRLNQTIELMKNYAPGMQIFKCGNLIGNYSIKYQVDVKNTLSQWCKASDKSLTIYPQTPFLGFLQSYSYAQTQNGIWGIVNNLKTGGFRIDFYQTDKSKNIDFHLDYATFTEQGAGLVKVLWNSGEENIATLSPDGIDFECANILSKNLDISLSRADCMLHNANKFNANIDFLSNLNGNRWLNEDVASGNPGLFVVFAKQSKNQYIATEYQQAQNGSVGEVTTAEMTDLGFGYAIGAWDDGTDAVFGYTTFNPPFKLKGGAKATAEISLNCADDDKAMPKYFYNNRQSCKFFSIDAHNSTNS